MKKILLISLPFLILCAVVFAFRILIIWPSIDLIMHSVAGASIALIAYLVYDKSISFTLSVSFVLLMAWEVFEMAGWRLFPMLNNCAYVFCNEDIFFWDGFFDIIVGIAAVLIITIILKKK